MLLGDSDTLRWLEIALEATGERAPAEDRARALLQKSTVLGWIHERAAASRDARQALELYRQSDDEIGITRALLLLGYHDLVLGEREQGRVSFEAACRHAQRAGDDALLGRALARVAATLPAGERLAALERARKLLTDARDYEPLARAYNDVAYAALLEGLPAEAVTFLDIALPTAERADSPMTTMLVSGSLGMACLFTGDVSRARWAFEVQLRLCRGHAYHYGAGEGLAGLAAIAAYEGRPERAARLRGAALAMGHPQRGDQPIADRLERDYFAPAREGWDEPAWRRAQIAGEAMSYDEATTFALDQSSPVQSLLDSVAG